MNIYTDHQGLQYFQTKKKLNWRQPSWYLRMFKFMYHIHYRLGFKTHKPDGLSRDSVEEKFWKQVHVFDARQLLDLENDDVGEEADAEDVELARIDVATWEKKNGLWAVP